MTLILNQSALVRCNNLQIIQSVLVDMTAATLYRCHQGLNMFYIYTGLQPYRQHAHLSPANPFHSVPRRHLALDTELAPSPFSFTFPCLYSLQYLFIAAVSVVLFVFRLLSDTEQSLSLDTWRDTKRGGRRRRRRLLILIWNRKAEPMRKSLCCLTGSSWFTAVMFEVICIWLHGRYSNIFSENNVYIYHLSFLLLIITDEQEEVLFALIYSLLLWNTEYFHLARIIWAGKYALYLNWSYLTSRGTWGNICRSLT